MQCIINNKVIQYEDNFNLLEFLRDKLHFTAAKNGCGEGACGACMVLLDGKPMRACLLTGEKVNGKTVLTVEGLSDFEKKAYSLAFARTGAVQCGFCIPGMVISAKALIDAKPEPTTLEIRQALRGNICRCTGYVKIIEAIKYAARCLRNGSVPDHATGSGVGAKAERIDAVEKVLGISKYCDDMYFDDMLYGSVLRSAYPRARVLSINVTRAEQLPGVSCVYTAADVSGKKTTGLLKKDWPAFIGVGEITRYRGDAIAAVAAVDKKTADAAVKLIEVEYEELIPVFAPKEALQPNAPVIDPNGNLLNKVEVKRGDVDEAIRTARYVTTNTYLLPCVDHAFLEPESCVAVPDDSGKITLYTACQTVYEVQHNLMDLTGIAPDKLRVIGAITGGGFGGKEDLSCQHHATMLAQKTGKPVKITFSRAESLLVHPKRHAMEVEMATACDENGRLTATRARIYADGGAYASMGGPVLQRACTHAAGPYIIPNVDIEGYGVYTNNPPAGAFRGFGVPQTNFACEGNMDILAEKLGMSPWDFRFLNAVEVGDRLPNGQICDEGTAMKEALIAVKEAYETHETAGLACGLKNTGKGVGVPDISRVKLKVKNGRVVIMTSAACIGQGLATMSAQVICETTGIALDKIDYMLPDTDLTPDAGSTVASRQTMFTGEASRLAATELATALRSATLAELEGREFYAEFFGKTDPITTEKANPYFHLGYSYAADVVVLDKDGKLEKVYAAHDVGRAINPLNVEGQIDGGVAMGLGLALREYLPIINGEPKAKYGTLGIMRATEMPEIKSIVIEKNPAEIAYGAKGIGEISLVPVASAVAAAYWKYDGIRRFALPLEQTPYKK
ncbi:MAG: selenium-dependent xanthine dehydrogenase [Negativicutes bacterium]|jgi:selenium-dependent xanthine dehydrogenase